MQWQVQHPESFLRGKFFFSEASVATSLSLFFGNWRETWKIPNGKSCSECLTIMVLVFLLGSSEWKFKSRFKVPWFLSDLSQKLRIICNQTWLPYSFPARIFNSLIYLISGAAQGLPCCQSYHLQFFNAYWTPCPINCYHQPLAWHQSFMFFFQQSVQIDEMVMDFL